MAASFELCDHGPAARQANLAAMGMAAQIEGVARFIGIVGDLGRMYEGDAELAGVISQRRPRGFAIKGIDVIESGDAQVLTLALKDERAIDQDLEARPAERVGHPDRIMIAKHGDPKTAHPDTVERLCQQPSRSGDRCAVVAMDVAGQRKQIDFETAQQLAGSVDKRREDVEMRVADVKDPVSVELPRQLLEGEFQLDQLEIEGIPSPPSIERCQAEAGAKRGEETGEQPLAPAAAAARGAAPVRAVLQTMSLNGPIGRGVN